MSLTTDTQRKRALKTVSGKTNTLNTKSIFEESISSIVPSHRDHVFSETIPTAATNPTLYQVNGPCEYVRFELEYISNSGSSSFWTVDPESKSGSSQVVLNEDINNDNDTGVEYVELPSSYDGRHAYAVKLPADYLDNSSNPKKDRVKYQNSALLHESNFKLQIVGLQHGQGYFPKLFSGVGVGAVEIPQDDRRDWIYDSAAGVVFQQNPPGPGDFPTNPTYIEGWLYIGDYLDESINSISGSIAVDIDTLQDDIVDLQNGGSSATTAIENDLVVKKLLGKGHTSPHKRHYNESIASYIYSNASHIPASAPPVVGATSYPFFHIESDKVEFLRLSGSYVDSGQSVDGRHGIKLHLPNDYVAQSSNSKKGSGHWFNGQAIHGTSGSIQLVPPFFNDNDSNYEATAYYFDDTTNALAVIPPEDERNWHIDYQAGILFQDAPEDTADLDPVYVDAWVWVGGMVSEGVGSGGGGGGPVGQPGGGGNGTIGAAEDGQYTDGLFSDFTETTAIGTAVDRFNEVLKALAPNPAPAMKEINYNVVGGTTFSGKLAFDGTHQSANFPFASVETYTQQGYAGFGALTVNDVYQSDGKIEADGNIDGTDLYFYKVGVISGNTVRIEGIINFSVQARVTANGVVQHEADVFGDADTGNLYLELNGENIHNINLASVIGAGDPPNGTDDSFELNGSGFIEISEPEPAVTEGGVIFPIFKSRSASFVIQAESMRSGHNKVRVKHNKGSVETVSNYVEWVWDDTTDQITFANSTVSVIDQQGSTYISGVRYHSDIELRYTTDILNVYKPIYSTNSIITNSSVGTSSAMPIPLVANGEDMEKTIAFQNDIEVEGASEPLINEVVDISATVPHPIRGESTGGNIQSQPILIYNPTSTAAPTSEDFVLEDFRLRSDVFTSQPAGLGSGFYDGSVLWDSELHMSGSNTDHSDGLQVWNGKLVSPINSIDTTRVGDFRNISDGGVLVTYDDNPDYSVEAGNITGTRTYYRWFKNTTNSVQRDFRIIYRGSTELIPYGNAFGTNSIKVSVKLPNTVSGQSTGWMDANSPFSMFQYGDNDGGYILPSGTGFDSTIGGTNSTNYFTVGQKTIQPDECVIVRVEADTSWTGNLSSLVVNWGASSAGNTAPGAIPAVEYLETLNGAQGGVSAKLSFGATHTVANYTPVVNVHTGVGGTDVNEQFATSSPSRGTHTTVSVSGDTNHSHSFQFLDGHLGELILEINGAEESDYTIDLEDYTLSGDHRVANTGFYSVSQALPVTYSNGLPNYSRIYRTAAFRVDTSLMRQGHNYVRAIHRIGATDYSTNYIDWVVDSNTETLQITTAVMDNWSDLNIISMSGIKYFSSPESLMRYTVEKLYANVYSDRNDAAGWSSINTLDITETRITGSGIDGKTVTTNQTSLPNLNKQPNCQLEDVMVESTIIWNGPNKVLPGSFGVNSNRSVSSTGTVYHPLKAPFGNGKHTGALSKTNFLINTISNSSTEATNENFSSEDYRLPDTSYVIASDITAADWDETQSVIIAPYENGMVQYNGYLIAPSKAGANGDFTSVNDGGIYQGPDGNVDYSDMNSQVSERVYLRPFYNNTTQDRSTITINIEGSGVLTSNKSGSGGDNNAGPIEDSNRFKLYVKLVEDSAATHAFSTTGWLDAGEPANYGNQDGDGVSLLPVSNDGLSLSLTNNSSFNIELPTGRNLFSTGSQQPRNYLIIKIIAHKNWSGHITRLGWE